MGFSGLTAPTRGLTGGRGKEGAGKEVVGAAPGRSAVEGSSGMRGMQASTATWEEGGAGGSGGGGGEHLFRAGKGQHSVVIEGKGRGEGEYEESEPAGHASVMVGGFLLPPSSEPLSLVLTAEVEEEGGREREGDRGEEQRPAGGDSPTSAARLMRD